MMKKVTISNSDQSHEWEKNFRFIIFVVRLFNLINLTQILSLKETNFIFEST